jgi:tetratricopeptide (TPR) repeat protein
VQAYERALALAPAYAPAQAALAPALLWLTDVASESLAERLEGHRRAIEAAEKAVALGPDIADGYAARGDVRTHVVWDWDGAQADFEQALAIKPGDASIQLGHAHLTAVLGRLTDAIAIAQHAAELDPLATDAFTYLGSYYSATGRLELARTMLLKALEITPEHDIAREELGLNYLLDENPTAALSVFEKSKNPMRRLHGIALAQHDLGHPREAQQAIDDMRRRFAYMSAYQIAEAYAWSGAPDSAFEWLERSYVERDPGLRRIAYDPRLRNLRGDPRHAALLRKMNLPDCVT